MYKNLNLILKQHLFNQNQHIEYQKKTTLMYFIFQYFGIILISVGFYCLNYFDFFQSYILNEKGLANAETVNGIRIMISFMVSSLFIGATIFFILLITIKYNFITSLKIASIFFNKQNLSFFFREKHYSNLFLEKEKELLDDFIAVINNDFNQDIRSINIKSIPVEYQNTLLELIDLYFKTLKPKI